MIEISGLTRYVRWLNEDAQLAVLEAVDAAEWSTALRRRVQHYGARYDYGSRRISTIEEAPPLPYWSRELIERFRSEGLSDQTFNQVIVNEYLPGQGIAPHIDRQDVFGEQVISISLGSACVMTFSRPSDGERDLLLEPGDLLLLRGEARHRWRHQIKPRKTDRWKGIFLKRGRRLAVTFRSTR